MPSYARLRITIVFFFPSAHLSLHFWTTRKLIWRKKLCHFILYIFYHASLSTDFFHMWSQYRYYTLKLLHFSCVVFISSSSRGYRCLTGVSLSILFELWSQSYTHTPLLSPMYWAQWLLLYFLRPTATQNVTSIQCSLRVWLPLEWCSLLYMASRTLQTCSALVVVALLSSKETLDTSETQKWQLALVSSQ